MSDADYLSTKQIAQRTGLSEHYWNTLRSTGGGPPYIKLARIVRYRWVDVDAWLVARARISTYAAAHPAALARA